MYWKKNKQQLEGEKELRHKYVLIALFILVLSSLSACSDKKMGNPVIENSSIEIGTTQNPNDGLLHFLIQIHDSGMEPDQEYKVRFVIQNPYISDLIETEKLEIPETYKTLHVENAILTGSSWEIKKEFTLDELKKSIKKNQAIIVELYDENRTIAQEVITTIKDNRGEPIVKVNSEAKMEQIELKETNEIAIFGEAVRDSIEEPGIVDIINPPYKFNLGEESYFLWITEDDGYIMNSEDTHTIYSLSNRSFKKVKEFIVNKD